MLTKFKSLFGTLIIVERVDDNIVDDLKLQVRQLEAMLQELTRKSNEKEANLIRCAESNDALRKQVNKLSKELQTKATLINKLDALHSDLVSAIDSTLQVYR